MSSSSAQATLVRFHEDFEKNGAPLGPVKFKQGKEPLIHPQQLVSAIRHELDSGETGKWSAKDFIVKAKALASKGQFEEARRLLKMGTDRFPNNEIIHTKYATSCMQGYEEGVKNFDDEAEKHLGIAIELQPLDVFPLTMLGKLYTNKGRHDLAEDVLIRAVAIAPYDAATFYALGRSYEKAANGSFARACYGHAASILDSDEGTKISKRLTSLKGDVARSLHQIERTTEQVFKFKDLFPIMRKVETASGRPQFQIQGSGKLGFPPAQFGL